MLKKLTVLICIACVIFSLSAYAEPTDVNFNDGYLPDGWSIIQPKEDTAISGTRVYQNEKTVRVEKVSESADRAEAIKTFEKIYGPGNIWFTFSLSGSGMSFIELKETADAENPAVKFAVSKDAFSYIADDGTAVPIKTGMNENERYTVKISGTFTQKKMSVCVDSDNAVNIGYLTASNAKNITAMSVYAVSAGNGISIYHFSTDSTGSKYCWDEFQEETEIAKWQFISTGEDIAEIQEINQNSYLGMHVAKSGQTWDNGDNINSDIRGTLANTSGDFKVTIKYSAIGSGETIIRLCRSNGGYWLTNLVLSGNTFGYNTTTSNTETVYRNLKAMQEHTIVLYCDRTAKLYDLYFDGQAVTVNQQQVSAGADVYLGWMLLQRRNDAPGGVHIYSFTVEDEYSRGSSIGDGVFTNADDEIITTLTNGTLKGKYAVTNNSKQEIKAVVVMMYYKGNMLKNITVTPVSVGVGKSIDVTGEINVMDSGDDSSVHMCLWNNMNDIVPFTETESVLGH